MKILTIAVPCYNSEAYMRNCIDSLLPGGEDVEILIVDDGSVKDRTPEIADEYAKAYPSIVRAIHQENKGHGGAVNTGIAAAEGIFFKVVDSDDWVDAEAYAEILATLKSMVRSGKLTDVLLSNFVYEKQGARNKRVMHYRKFFPKNQLFTWKDMKPLAMNRQVLMHSIIFRTDILRESGLELPEHTFYVDNLYAYIPFLKVETLYYMDVNFYRYFIGRDDQSVNEKVMISRLDQQVKVNNMMIDFMGEEGKKAKGKQWTFLVHSLRTIMMVTTVMQIRANTPEALEGKKELWKRLKEKDYGAYMWIRMSLLGITANLPGKPGRKFIELAYKITQHRYGFN